MQWYDYHIIYMRMYKWIHEIDRVHAKASDRAVVNSSTAQRSLIYPTLLVAACCHERSMQALQPWQRRLQLAQPKQDLSAQVGKDSARRRENSLEFSFFEQYRM